MPTYDYHCTACSHRFELFQSITAKPVKKCPACNKSKVSRLLGTGAGMIFKGSGFYITDYRSEGYKSAAKAESGGKTESSSPATAKSDSSASTAKTETPKAAKKAS